MEWLYLVVFICLATSAIAGMSLAPWVPTWQKDLPRIFALAKLQPGETFYDLGCGNGKVVWYAARHFNCRAVGIELSLPLWLYCVLSRVVHPHSRVRFRYGSIFHSHFGDADVVYVFGMPKALQHKLRQKLEQELRPGARVISYTFPITGWEPVVIDKPTPHDITLYLYRR